ncbi:hypothetical protein GGI11_002011 [Coemansia sp. RSA 2049]|nr:hypothetical protein LPJ72_002049 [Coemansia sp. Benny D160-2]KAJ2521398.1 hypothetical protein H4217_001416 [Coemansia sp. RSA 1939]KAJ2521434.1 hypothetical protein GGI11_002011 [Coemansia sp. RSA 2049]KAJ2617731.1 hypothetical protein EV177_000409 [Coemansia sp. RSA 1804]KAJ2684727.1 hypothetical protein GGH99_003957 [Coemansia sp. RSA 1285]
MDEPLFGGISRREIFIERFANAFIISTTMGTLATSVVQAVRTGVYMHTLLGLAVCLFAAIEVRLVNWYRVGDLEPTFKYIIFMLGFSISFLCLVANMYFFLF